MEVRIISTSVLDDHPVKKVFKDAKVFHAVDFRSKKPQQLLDENLITLNGFESMKNGRKHHHELSTPSQIGLILSFLKILKSNHGPLLICEEDCVPSPDLPEIIDEMLLNSSDFDMVVFGPLMYQENIHTPSVFKNFNFLTNYYWGNHAVLFTPQGREKIIKHLNGPYDVQLDALFSRLAMYTSEVKILIQVRGEPLAIQSDKPTQLQKQEGVHQLLGDDCFPLCHLNHSSVWFLIILILFLVTAISNSINKSGDRFYCPKLKKMINKRK